MLSETCAKYNIWNTTRWSSGRRHCSFTAVTWVRIPSESPIFAGVVEQADAMDLKSIEYFIRVGSNPTTSTKDQFLRWVGPMLIRDPPFSYALHSFFHVGSV